MHNLHGVDAYGSCALSSHCKQSPHAGEPRQAWALSARLRGTHNCRLRIASQLVERVLMFDCARTVASNVGVQQRPSLVHCGLVLRGLSARCPRLQAGRSTSVGSACGSCRVGWAAWDGMALEVWKVWRPPARTGHGHGSKIEASHCIPTSTYYVYQTLGFKQIPIRHMHISRPPMPH